MTLTSDGWGDGLRKNWSAGKVQQLESVLGNVAINLEKWVIHIRERRLDAECENRQKREAGKVCEARKAVVARESERIKNLDSCVDGWARATQIRDYLSALNAKLAANEVKPTDPEHFSKWLRWAQWYADSVCPVTPTPLRPEIDEPVDRINKRIEELDLTSNAQRAFEQGQVADTDELARLKRE